MPGTATKTKPFEHIGKSRGCEDHDHDLIHELSHRLDAAWRYDQYIANAEGHAKAQELWRELKKQDEANIKRLKELVAKEIEMGCF